MDLPPRSATPPRRTLPTLPAQASPPRAAPSLSSLQPPPRGGGGGADPDDPLGLGLSRGSRAPLPQPAAIAAAAPGPPSPGLGRQPPSLDTLRAGKKPPPLPAGKLAVVSTYYSHAGEDDGELTVAQVQQFLSAEGIDVDDDYVQGLLATYDEDGNGTLSLDEFSVLVAQVAPTMLDADDGGEAGMGGGMQKPDWDDLRAKAGAFADLHAQRFPVGKKDWDDMSESKQKMVMGGSACWCLALFVFLLQVFSVILEDECIELGASTQCSDPNGATFSSDVEPAVDIIFIVDSSDSMVQFDGANSGNYFRFIQHLASNTSAVGDRWRIIVANSEDGCHNNAGGFLSVDTPPPGAVPAFETATHGWVGAKYPFTEAALVVAKRAVEKTATGQCNENFIRREALLHVILVSDSETPWEPFVDYLVEQKNNDLSLVKVSVFRSHDHAAPPVQYTAAALGVGAADFATDAYTVSAAALPGYGYAEAAAQTGGVDGSVTASDWRHACCEHTRNPATTGLSGMFLRDCLRLQMKSSVVISTRRRRTARRAMTVRTACAQPIAFALLLLGVRISLPPVLSCARSKPPRLGRANCSRKALVRRHRHLRRPEACAPFPSTAPAVMTAMTQQ